MHVDTNGIGIIHLISNSGYNIIYIHTYNVSLPSIVTHINFNIRLKFNAECHVHYSSLYKIIHMGVQTPHILLLHSV